MPELRVVRVLSNNAVEVRAAENSGDGRYQQSRVIVGKGVGFHTKPGELISATSEHPLDGSSQREYVELSAEQQDILASLNAINPTQLAVISTAIDLASDVLGGLHPSVYVILAEHLAVALERVDRGERITTTLAKEIRAVFPREFSAAELVVHYLNAHVDTRDLPIDEAAFITLHLSAARHGDTVKKPLATANAISQADQMIRQASGLQQSSGAEPSGEQGQESTDDELPLHLTFLLARLRQHRVRTNPLHDVIRQRCAFEYELASRVVHMLSATCELPRHLDTTGEVAFLAMFLHGYLQ